ncbi:imidazole glycerol phosphate synthase [Campylobacter sp. 9BO]|uniref:imidazole glycerol phosphate synthase n=1 Tax=Campylobacter sp. 9BO TaxID=3424759 RepID=UPI003D33D240
MDFKNIKIQIEKVNEMLVAFERDEELLAKELEPCMDVFEFNSAIDKTKEKIRNTADEGTFFKNVFNTNDYYENISLYLEQVQFSIDHKIKKSGISPESNIKLQKSLKTIEDTIGILVTEYGNSIKADKYRFIKRDNTVRVNIKKVLNELVALKKRLEKVIKIESKIISNVILKDFKTIFTFFANCVKVAKSRKDELLLVEIAGISDKFLNMIKPVFGDKSLETDNMIYYYLFYEIREIKASAIGQKLA